MSTEDCPHWCVGHHGPGAWDPRPAHRADSGFVHATGPRPTPVVTLSTGVAADAVVQSETFDVVLFQYSRLSEGGLGITSEEEWVFLGGKLHALTVTKESARRLYRTLGSVLLL